MAPQLRRPPREVVERIASEEAEKHKTDTHLVRGGSRRPAAYAARVAAWARIVEVTGCSIQGLSDVWGCDRQPISHALRRLLDPKKGTVKLLRTDVGTEIVRPRLPRLLLPHSAAIRFIESVVEYDTNGGCWLWPAAGNSPRGHVQLAPGVSELAYRASYRAFKGPLDPGMYVCHRCDVPACVRPDHLFLGTHLDNIDDCVAKGRTAWGERAANAKLTIEAARAIFVSTERAPILAARYGVNRTVISDIWHRARWARATAGLSAPPRRGQSDFAHAIDEALS